jgi:diaminohydroxyphosphoribosylaminopyrimidine deaminase/5-amino-6-(5-phosphoribosylamino)uracil reductase
MRRPSPKDAQAAERYMRLALKEAVKGVGRTSPNPAVGVVVVRNGRVLGRGFHRRAGEAHAEVEALAEAGDGARGADLYSTLEPCGHYGKTPPCSLAILRAGVARVYVGSLDPNPLVRGRGLRRLRKAGVDVRTGILRTETDAINRPFFKLMEAGLPYVTLKLAVTLDGRLATRTGDSRWVSGERARAWVHARRDVTDAVLVGAGTAKLDDPRLTTRLKGRRGRDPVRVVVDSNLGLSPSLKVFSQRSSAKTLVACLMAAPAASQRRLERGGAVVWRLPGDGRGRVSLRALLGRLAQTGISSVLAEGGAGLGTSLVREGLVDELVLFFAPKLLGAPGISWLGELGIGRMRSTLRVADLQVSRVGADVMLTCFFPRRRRGRA